jgi:hypothetical protein
MPFSFSKEDIEQINEILGAQPQEMDSSWSWRLANEQGNLSLVLNIYNEVELGGETKGSLISVQTKHGYFELHNCDSFLVFEPDEIIFVEAKEETVTSLIVGKACTCSLFSNISKEVLNADFDSLDAPVLLSAMQLSLTESVI